MQSIPQSEPALFHDPPSEDRRCCALRSMASGKAGKLSEIVPELLKVGGLPLRGALLDMFRSVWSASYASMDWRHAQIVPVLVDSGLSLPFRRRLYTACVLTVLLFGAECWTPSSLIFGVLMPFIISVSEPSWGFRGNGRSSSALRRLSCGICGGTLSVSRIEFAPASWSGLAT